MTGAPCTYIYSSYYYALFDTCAGPIWVQHPWSYPGLCWRSDVGTLKTKQAAYQNLWKIKTYSKRTWKIVFGAIKMCLNFNLKPKYDLHMYQNFVLHIFELHRYVWFHVRMKSMFGSEKVTFCKNCRIQKTRQKVVLKIFWWIEIVSMDPKSNVKLSGDHFEYSYIFLQ